MLLLFAAAAAAAAAVGFLSAGCLVVCVCVGVVGAGVRSLAKLLQTSSEMIFCPLSLSSPYNNADNLLRDLLMQEK